MRDIGVSIQFFPFNWGFSIGYGRWVSGFNPMWGVEFGPFTILIHTGH